MRTKLDLTFKGGRTDCATSPTTTDENNIPEADFSGQELFSWFEEEMDMTPEEVIIFFCTLYKFYILLRLRTQAC